MKTKLTARERAILKATKKMSLRVAARYLQRHGYMTVSASSICRVLKRLRKEDGGG